MARVSYIARRSLMNGVTAGTTVDFDFSVSGMDRQTKVDRHDQISLDGSREVLKNRTDTFYKVTTEAMLEADFANVRQFLDSVDGGESFTFDPYGTYAVPVTEFTGAILEGKGYTEKRISQRYISVSFTVKV